MSYCFRGEQFEGEFKVVNFQCLIQQHILIFRIIFEFAQYSWYLKCYHDYAEQNLDKTALI